uniref:Uncharacterized protein n=1 Tax=Amphimedon queenslandica TaxID=400682 RepID=A0A1X7T0Y4_AMPQE
MSLEDKCWAAFERGDHKEAVRLLSLVKELNKIKRIYIVTNYTSLLHLSSRNGWLDVTKDLITKYHCDPHERDDLDWTCLHYAARDNHVDVMRYLIDECHCDPMAVDRLLGWTPLHRAAHWGSSAAAEYLLSTGKCDPLAKDNEGKTPFKLAKKEGETDTLSLAVEEEEEEGGRERKGESDRPDEMTSEVYQFGWCLQCTSKHHFFPPRYFHVFSLRLAYKMAQPQEDDQLKRCCTFWKNGLYWSNSDGVGSLVEIVDESQCVLVMMSFEKGYSDNMVSLRRDVIGKVMSVYKESCPSLEVKELVIDPKELAYPVDTPRERTVYSVKAVMSAIVKREEFLVNATGTRRTRLKEILADESLSDISSLSLLGGRDIKEVIEITEEFKTPLTPIKLDIKDLADVIKELTSDQHLPCSVWHRLGLQLGLYDPRLVDIDKKNRGDPVECFRECMSAWLRGQDRVREKGGPSWSSLATALDTIEQKPIASYIRDKYL